jgi:cytochrome P450
LLTIYQDLAAQVTQTNSRPKSPAIQQFIGHIVGPTSLLFTEGEQWKKIRSLFNPGFSLAHLMTLVPSIVDDTMIFCEVLGEHADSGEVRPIETAAAHLTIDIMGHIILDIDLNSQREQNELVEAFRNQISWTPSNTTLNPFEGFNPIRPFMHKYYESKMNNYLERVLDDRYATSATRDTIKSRCKPAIDLALDEYSRQQDEDNVIKSTKGIDKAFKTVAIDQMKTFIFAGHDTSSSTLAYAYHLLNLHPDKLATARTELDQVFGENMDSIQTGELIKQNPNLLNNVPYILSIIKETLRLYTPALTVRQGQGKIIYEGVTYDTEGFQVLVLSLGMHRNAEYFPSPDEFIPERFMPAPDNFQEIPKDVYRPFEKGPRDCIGQQLAILEMKIILAMTLRDFDIKADYETWDKRLGREKPGDILDGRRGMFGKQITRASLSEYSLKLSFRRSCVSAADSQCKAA